MVVKYSRAQRRHDYARLKKKRQYHWGYGHKNNWRTWGKTDRRGEIEFMPPDVSGSVTRTPTPCSCYMCGNPRHSWIDINLTIQELKAEDSFKDQMKDFFMDISEGDTIYIDGDSGFCTGSYEKVTETKTKYDENTGEPYKVICCGDHEFDARSGLAITPPLAYYISVEN